MNHSPRLHLLTSVLACVLVVWLAMAALPAAPVADPMPASAPAVASGSGYPAPQIDASPPQEPAPTF